MIKVLMIGPARSVKGGMTTVVDNYYLSELQNQVNLKYIETCNDKNFLLKGIKEIIGFFSFIINYKKYEVVHIHMASRRSTFRKGLYVNLAKKANKKVIIHIHGAEYKLFYNECTEKKKQRIKQILNNADKIIVLSEEWKDYFGNLVPEEKIEVLYNSVVMPNDFDKDFSKFNMLFLGRIGERKGVYDLIDVLKIIKKETSNWTLNVGGDGEVEKLKSIIKHENLDNNIKYVGWISGEDKEKLLRISNIYILPSYNEGMPMSVLEAMAYKNITISTNVGGIPKVIDNNNNGFLIDPGDKNELKEVLLKILTKRVELEKISNNARRTIESKFNSKRNLNKLIDIYKK